MRPVMAAVLVSLAAAGCGDLDTGGVAPFAEIGEPCLTHGACKTGKCVAVNRCPVRPGQPLRALDRYCSLGCEDDSECKILEPAAVCTLWCDSPGAPSSGKCMPATYRIDNKELDGTSGLCYRQVLPDELKRCNP
jgi:hypothetical protein